MAHKLNKYFNVVGDTGDLSNERALIDGFVTESIQQNGVLIKYLPRTFVKEDKLFGEDVISLFDSNAFEIEAYVETFEEYEGDGEIITPWGMEVNDIIRLRFSESRYKEESTTAGLQYKRPLEGDLIYWVAGKTLFQIKYASSKSVWYPQGFLPSYLVTAEKFDYSMETFNTNDTDIDSISNANLPADITPDVGDNQDIQTDADSIIVFDENNPFGDN